MFCHFGGLLDTKSQKIYVRLKDKIIHQQGKDIVPTTIFKHSLSTVYHHCIKYTHISKTPFKSLEYFLGQSGRLPSTILYITPIRLWPSKACFRAHSSKRIQPMDLENIQNIATRFCIHMYKRNVLTLSASRQLLLTLNIHV